MDWEDIRSFLAIARAGSLSGAARTLGVRQSTMSRRLDAMEERAGARLLQRTSRGFDLTPLGEAVLGNAERMEAEAMSVERVVQGRDVALSGLVRITTVDLIANMILPSAIARVQAQYPGITVEILPETRALNLSKREADLAIRMVRFEGQELVSRRIGMAGQALFASPDYLARCPLPLGDGTGHALVTVLEDQTHLPEMRWMHDMMPQARIAVRTSSREAQIAAIRAGLGIACLPRLAGLTSGVVRIAEVGQPPKREIWLGVHADLRTMPRVRAMIDALDIEFAAWRGDLDPDDD